MEKLRKVPERKLKNDSENFFKLISPKVTTNQMYQPTCWVSPDCFNQSPNRGRRVQQEFRGQQVLAAQNVELMYPREPESRGATPAGMNLHHKRPDGCFPPEIMLSGTRGECCCWGCGAKRCGTTEPSNGDAARGEDECNAQLESDLEEELEPPLPLRADNEWQHYPFLLPHHYMHSYGEWPYNLNPAYRYPPQSCHLYAPWQHRTPWNGPQNELQLHDNFMNNIVAQGSVSVNVPHFSVPPVEAVTQVSALNLCAAGAEESVSHQREKRRTIRLPDECRNVFITYSLDVSSEMVAFVDFLTKQGFRPAIGLFDNSIRSMGINEWMDSYLKDPLTLIIIAISPKYKEDIEGPVVDSHGLHTKYIHSMMQNEFIKQGSLNFRFIPVLFLCSSQKHVPGWLQNTRVYRWPQDTEDLLLRLLREERYMPPPVPVKPSLIIRPVTTRDAATL